MLKYGCLAAKALPSHPRRCAVRSRGFKPVYQVSSVSFDSRYSHRFVRDRCNIAAFTLIEVLVVVAIIALLAAILLPSLKAARTQAKVTVCKANCKQIATMIATYHKPSTTVMCPSCSTTRAVFATSKAQEPAPRPEQS